MSPEQDDDDVPRPALWLGWAGAIPFVVAAAVALAAQGETVYWARTALTAYGACILAFMGGIHWGLATAPLTPDPSWQRLGTAVIPALIAWFALAFLPTSSALVILALGFALLLAHDIVATRLGRAPYWYPRLRWPLTLVVVGALVLGSFA